MIRHERAPLGWRRALFFCVKRVSVFVAKAHALAYRVDGLGLRLVIRTHKHLCEQAHQDELNADGEHDDGDCEERISYERLAAELSEQGPEERHERDDERG